MRKKFTSRAELVKQVAEQTGVPNNVVESVLSSVEVMICSVHSTGVEVRTNAGVFTQKPVPARSGEMNGVAWSKEAGVALAFRPSVPFRH